MQLKVVSRAEVEEHSRDRVVPMRSAAEPRVQVAAGDVVLYRTLQGHVTPARLVEAADGGWLAHDARHTRGLIYLDPDTITSRLPRPDLVGEAA